MSDKLIDNVMTRKKLADIKVEKKLSQPQVTTPTETKPNTETEPKSFTDSYNSYIQSLGNQKLNANNEIAIAEQSTKKYIDNYLKNQGLYGTGVGASTNMASSLGANQLRNSNEQTYNTSVNKYNTDYNESQYNQAIQTIENMSGSKTKEELQKYIEQKYSKDAAITSQTMQSINDYINENDSLSSFEDNRKQMLYSMDSAFESITDADQRKQYLSIYNKVKNATTQEEYNTALDELENFSTSISNIEQALNDQQLQEKTPSIIENAKQYVADGKFGSKVVANKGAVADSFGKFLGNSSSRQYKSVKAIVELAENGKIPNGTIIDMNYGAGNAHFMYVDGNWIEILSAGTSGIKSTQVNKYLDNLGIKYK